MFQKIFPSVFFLLFFVVSIQAQENKIVLSHPQMISWSSVKIQTKEEGKFVLKILNSQGIIKLEKELNISESRVIVFKYNFTSFQKGIYTFQLWKKGTLTFSEKYLK